MSFWYKVMDKPQELAILIAKAEKLEAKDEDLAELIKILSEEDTLRVTARESCFRALSSNPRNALIRLLLARLYYLDDLGEFCIRELLELKKYSDSPSVGKLIDSFGEFAAAFGPAEAELKADTKTPENRASRVEGEKVVAEIDLDLDFESALGEMVEQKE